MLPDQIPQLKEQLRREIVRLIGNETQDRYADLLGLGQPRVSDLIRGRLKRFSLEKLIGVLNRVDRRIELRVVAESKESLGRMNAEFWKERRRGG